MQSPLDLYQDFFVLLKQPNGHNGMPLGIQQQTQKQNACMED